MKVITLNEFGEDAFVLLLENLADNCKDKNKDWFPVLLTNYKKYIEWFFAIDENEEFAAFSTIQKFYDGCYRVLTRSYVVDKHRRSNLLAYRKPVTTTENHHLSPPSYMIQSQLKYLDNKFDTIFISFEDIKKSRVTVNMSRKLEVNTGLDWTVGGGMYLTCPNPASKNCWQNVCYSGVEPNLKKISKEEWIESYGK
jgi:hypothetical protein